MTDKRNGKEQNIQVIENKKSREELQEERRIRRNRRNAIFIAATLVLTAMIYSFYDRSFNACEEMTRIPNSNTNLTQFESFKNGYLKYSRDGISYMDHSGKIIWTEAFNMEKPMISVRGDYAALADLEGNEVKIFNDSGRAGGALMPYPIRSVQVAEQGVFCVVLEGKEFNYIRLYDKEGKNLTEIRTQIQDNGYPMSVAISSDGEKMVASFYCIEGISSKNIISFYHFGEGGKGQHGNLVGTYQLENTLIPKVEFMDDESVCAVGDNMTIFYKMDHKPVKVREVKFDEEIKSVFSNEKYVGYIYENDPVDVENRKKEPYQVELYNKKGKLKKSFGKTKIYDHVKIQDNVIFSYVGSRCSMTRTNGTEFFDKDMGENIFNILKTEKQYEYIFVYQDHSARVKLKNSLGEEKISNGYKEIEEDEK